MSRIIPKVYMAGPDVFFQNAAEIKEAKKEIATLAGILPLFPLDNVAKDLFARQDLSPEQKGLVIYKANEILMKKADGIIANVTPWHGPSLDVGTAFEIGFMKAQSKPIECYTNSPVNFSERVRGWLKKKNIDIIKDENGVERDKKLKMMIENFGQTVSDNIMIDGATRLSGGSISKPVRLSKKELYKSLEQFQMAAEKFAEKFKKGTYLTNPKEEEKLLEPFLTQLDL